MTNESIATSFDAWLADDSTHWVGEQDAAYQAWLHVHETVVEGLVADNESSNSRLHEVAVACATAEQERDALKAECEGLRKHAELHAQIQRAAGELPTGWEIRVCVEHEAGYVELWDQDGCEVDFPNSCETLALTVSDAIDHACEQGGQSNDD